MGIKLAENLVEAIAEEQWKVDLPDPSYSFVARAKGLAEKLEINAPHFTQCLWWGVHFHRLNEVLSYFEKKYHEAEPEAYKPTVQDHLHFLHLST